MEPLTYTEEQILSFLREGRYDAEIAVRLGISNAEVGRRIEAICRKTGLPGKAALKVPSGLAVALPGEVEPASAAEAVQNEAGRIRADWPTAILGTLATIAFIVGVATLAFRRSEPEALFPGPIEWTLAAGSGIQVASATATPTSTPTPAMIDGVVPKVMTEGALAVLPADVEVIYTARASATSPVRLLRAYRSAPGNQQLATDVLYTPPDGFDILDVLSTNDGSDIVVEIAPATDNGRGPTELQFFRSKDGGVTWVPAGPSLTFSRADLAGDRGASLAAFDGDDVLIAIHRGGQDSRYKTLNGDEIVANEGEFAVPWTDTTWARVVPSPEGAGYVVGAQTYIFGPEITHGVRFFEAQRLMAAAWSVNLNGFIGMYALDGKALSVTEIGIRKIIWIVGWLDPMSTIATYYRNGILQPVVFTPSMGAMRELRLTQDGAVFQEVVALRTGPAAVVAPAETCLALYEQPDAASPVVTCAAPGVRLLASGLHSKRDEGGVWYGMTVGQFGPVGWVRPGPALRFDDPAFVPERDYRYANTLATVRPPGKSECAEVRQAASESDPVVACLQAGMLVGHALNPLGSSGGQQWYGVFYPSACFPVTGCTGNAIGFIRAEHLERQP